MLFHFDDNIQTTTSLFTKKTLSANALRGIVPYIAMNEVYVNRGGTGEGKMDREDGRTKIPAPVAWRRPWLGRSPTRGLSRPTAARGGQASHRWRISWKVPEVEKDANRALAAQKRRRQGLQRAYPGRRASLSLSSTQTRRRGARPRFGRSIPWGCGSNGTGCAGGPWSTRKDAATGSPHTWRRTA